MQDATDMDLLRQYADRNSEEAFVRENAAKKRVAHALEKLHRYSSHPVGLGLLQTRLGRARSAGSETVAPPVGGSPLPP
jgi:hypothetical protein